MTKRKQFWELGLNPITMKKPEKYITVYGGVGVVREPYPGEDQGIKHK